MALQKLSDETALYMTRADELKRARDYVHKPLDTGTVDIEVIKLQAQLLLEAARGKELETLLESTDNTSRLEVR